MIAKELRIVTDIAREPFPKDNIFQEIKIRALNGFYNYAAYDSLEEQEIARLKDKGFKVTIGQNKKNPWFVIEW